MRGLPGCALHIGTSAIGWHDFYFSPGPVRVLLHVFRRSMKPFLARLRVGPYYKGLLYLIGNEGKHPAEAAGSTLQLIATVVKSLAETFD